ncbi:MAG: S9 family peptidase [Acidimicrobiales bacterium]
MTAAPFGSWPSPVTADVLTERTVRLGDLRAVDGDLFWVEGRPAEGGRQVVVRAPAGGAPTDLLPDGFSARTAVHEYGGAPYAPVERGLVFANFADQRLWRVEGDTCRALTPEPPEPSAWRYADMHELGDRWVVCVRERHHGPTAPEVENDLVTVPAAGGDPVALVGGYDFFAAPRPSPDGSRLAWLAWNHPDMPWDATELWVADVVAASGSLALARHRRVAGSDERPESISQPRWSPDGRLHWVSDRSGWWNLYADDGGEGLPLAPMAAELTKPDWVFGQSTYAFLADGRLVASWTDQGTGHIGVLDPATGGLAEVATPFTSFSAVVATGDGVAALVASSTEATAVVRIAIPHGRHTVVRRSRDVGIDPVWVSHPEAITFPTAGGAIAHAFWYSPTSLEHVGPPGELPPLVVMSHGGPTSSASPALDLGVQFWTSRGLGVVDVDYRGSSGYGREYRRALDGAWGVADVDDCVAAALFLADHGLADPSRLAIRGASAGGFTTLCALAFHDVFAAGASLYGVADLEALAADTHKFERRYLDRLVGPPARAATPPKRQLPGPRPEQADRYRQRSPIHHADRLSCPVIVLQGLDDRVVPPAQAEVMVAALRAKGLPVAYVTFPGEQHGFRRAETIRGAAEAELSFYGQVLGFAPAGDIEPVAVENLGR